jgi:hypothetical protein
VQSLAIGPALSNVDFSETIDMLGTSARYVKLRILSNHNGRDFTDPLGDDGATNFAGLSEVQFFAVPEPASGALLFVSMAAVALSTRRSRRRAELN